MIPAAAPDDAPLEQDADEPEAAARRAGRFGDGFFPALGDPEVAYEEAVYHGWTDDLLERVRSFDVAAESALLVGHNPALQNLCLLLAAPSPERERIARDLHDLLGHTLTLITVKAELAAKLAERDLPAAAQEIRELEAVSRDALRQVREAVGGDRSGGPAGEMAIARISLNTARAELRSEI